MSDVQYEIYEAKGSSTERMLYLGSDRKAALDAYNDGSNFHGVSVMVNGIYNHVATVAFREDAELLAMTDDLC